METVDEKVTFLTLYSSCRREEKEEDEEKIDK